MSVSLEEVINHGGYDLSKIDDARWLLGKQEEFEELIEKAEELNEEYEEYEEYIEYCEDEEKDEDEILDFEQYIKEFKKD